MAPRSVQTKHTRHYRSTALHRSVRISQSTIITRITTAIPSRNQLCEKTVDSYEKPIKLKSKNQGPFFREHIPMRIVKIEYLISEGRFARSIRWNHILQEIKKAVGDVVWPPGNASFVINPSTGRGRGEGNGVKPIKDACMLSLQKSGWDTNDRKNPLRIDAVKPLPDGRMVALGVCAPERI